MLNASLIRIYSRVLCLLLLLVLLLAGLVAGHAIVNQPPIAGDDSYTRHGNGSIGPFFSNDSDPDGDPLSLQILTNPAHGTLGVTSAVDSKYYELTDLGYTGADSFTYKACDNHGDCSNAATVSLTIVNQPPPQWATLIQCMEARM